MGKNIFAKVFLWMFIGLLITFGTSFYVSTQEFLAWNVLKLGWVWFIIELAIVIFLAARITKMSSFTAKLSFALYSFVTGLMLSYIFIIFSLPSILLVFGAAALMFGVFGLYGYFTKVDLTKISSILAMGLVGIIIVSLINIFLGNAMVDTIISIVGIVIFTLFVVYDIQKINSFSSFSNIPTDNLAIYGALQLYLDFINIFLNLLNLFGNSKD